MKNYPRLALRYAQRKIRQTSVETKLRNPVQDPNQSCKDQIQSMPRHLGIAKEASVPLKSSHSRRSLLREEAIAKLTLEY